MKPFDRPASAEPGSRTAEGAAAATRIDLGAAPDPSGIAWIHDELRRSLESAHKLLRRHLRETESHAGSDVSARELGGVRQALSLIHQAAGALNVVGSPAAARVLEASDGALRWALQRPSRVNASLVDRIEQASFAVIDWLGRLKAGRPVSTLHLFPQLRVLLETAGAERVHPADLWFKSWQFTPLPVEAGIQPRPIDERSLTALEQLTLANIKTPSPLILARISDFYAGVAATASGPAGSQRQALWQLAAAVFEALAKGLLQEDVFNKRLGSRLLSSLRSLHRGQDGDDASLRALAHDLLFYCAQAAPASGGQRAPRLAMARSAYGLDADPRVDYSSSPLGRFDPAVMVQARKRVTAAKGVWSAVVAGEVLHLGSLVEFFSLLADSLRRMFADGADLAEQLESVAVRCAADGAAPGAGVAMEVATALLYVEAAIEDAESSGPGPDRPMALLAQRIDAARATGSAQPLEGWIEDLYGRVADQQTQGTVVQELRTSMAAAEQHLDRFFREQSDRDALVAVPALLQTIHGALRVIGVDQGALAVQQMRREIDAIAADDSAPPPERHERLAANMGMLGFMFDMLGVQPALARTLFRFDTASARLVAVGAKPSAPPPPVAAPAPVAATDTTMAVDRVDSEPTAIAGVAPSASEDVSREQADPELQEIFGDEAEQLLEAARRRLGDWRNGRDEADALGELRRVFHTLKGSARMVGRVDVGDLAWEAEQRYNARRLHDSERQPDEATAAVDAQDDVRLREWTSWTVDRIAGLLGRPAAAVPEAATSEGGPDDSAPFELTMPLPEVTERDHPDDLLDLDITVPGELDFDLSWDEPARPDEAARPPDSSAEDDGLDDGFALPDAAQKPEPLGFPADLPTAADLELDLDFGVQPAPSQSSGATRWGDSLLPPEPAPAPMHRVSRELDVEDVGRMSRLPPADMPDLSFITLDLSDPKAPPTPDFPAATPQADDPDTMSDWPSEGEASGLKEETDPSMLPGWAENDAAAAASGHDLGSSTAAEVEPVLTPPTSEPEPAGSETAPTAADEGSPVSVQPPTANDAVPDGAAPADAEPPEWDQAPPAPAPATSWDTEPIAAWNDAPVTDESQPAWVDELPAEQPAADVPPVDVPPADAPPLRDAPPETAAPTPAWDAAASPAVGNAPLADAAQPAWNDQPPAYVPATDASPPVDAAPQTVTPAPEPEPQPAPAPVSDPPPPAWTDVPEPAWKDAPSTDALPPTWDQTVDTAASAPAWDPAPSPGWIEAPVAEELQLGYGVPAPEGIDLSTGELPLIDPFAIDSSPQNESPQEPSPSGGTLTTDQSVRQIGPLQVPVALFNIFLNEADELSRQLCSELAGWAMQPDQPVPSTANDRLHALTGSSATVGYSALGDLARELEAALLREQQFAAEGGLRDQDDALLFSDAAEEIRQLLHQFAAGFLRSPSADLLQRLAAFQSRAMGRLPPAPIADAAPVEPDPNSAAPATDWLADIRGVDRVEAELFPIFEEEANDLLPQLAAALGDWARQPGRLASANAAMRHLHTFKGGARLAGAMRLGELAHRLETRIEELTADDSAVQGGAVESLLAGSDALLHTFEALRESSARARAIGDAQAFSPPAEPAVQAASPASDEASAMPTAPVAAPSEVEAVQPVIDWSRFSQAAPAAAPATSRGSVAAAQASIKVRASLLDRMVTQSSEVNMSRARIEVEMGQMRGAMGELGDNIDRLRQQLHDIELQAETQISSRSDSMRSGMLPFDPLEIDRFTRLQELTRMMAESVNDVATVQRSLKRNLQRTEDELAAQTRLTRDLQSDLLRTRMVEFDTLADRLQRVVRQAASEYGKQVELHISGGNIELDRSVLDRLTPALEHLLRNGVIHGIEAPEQRSWVGKPASGQLQIHLHQHGNEVGIDVDDDGAGLDLARIRARAEAMGQWLADGQETEMIFSPGFSTAERLTEMAGRGVGLDVVRNELTALEGQIEVSSSPGQGCRFSMLLPLTTAMTQVLMLRCGDLTVALPATMVERVRHITESELAAAQADGFYLYGDLMLPMYWLGALLGHSTDSAEAFGRSRPLIIAHSGKQRVALRVDETLGQQEAVIRHLGPQLSRIPGLVGMSMLASGSVALIYNPLTLVAEYGHVASSGMLPRHSSRPVHGMAASSPLVLVVDDSLTVRRVTQRLLLREGYRVELAKDGIEALERIEQELPGVVLSDIEMPRMDGYEFVGQLRSAARTRSLPVVMITSRIADRHRVHAESLGVARYLGKPYADEDLLAAVAECLKQTAQPD